MEKRFEVDEATLVHDADATTLTDVLNNPERAGFYLFDIVPIYGFGKVKVIWARHAEESRANSVHH